MELVIEAVSKNKRGVLANDTWWNADNSLEGEVFKDVKKGNKLDVENSGKWIKSFEVVGQGVLPTKAKSTSTESAPTASYTSSKTPEVQDRIGRGNAVNAVLGSPYLGTLIEKLAGSEAEAIQNTQNMIEKVAAYINTGTFVEVK